LLCHPKIDFFRDHQPYTMKNITRFEILEKLGQGAMAAVYKAHDPNIDRTLAIKVLHKERCEDPEYRRRFLREAKAAGHLSHQNIVTVYDVGEMDDRPYIAMELLEGMPLDEVMKIEPRLPLIDVVVIGIQLAKALHYAHSKGIVHRDIKPSNIILRPDSNDIKITDFGIAHMEDTSLTQQTRMGEVLGTPQYMSPEQAKGEKVDGRSDLFSVGVILYQLLTGERPFGGDTLTTLLLEITTKDPTPINQLVPNVPVSLRQIVEKLLNKRPEKRFQTGGELGRSLIRTLHKVKEETKRGEGSRIVPIRVKWTVLMAAIVAFTMILSTTLIYRKQYKAMTSQAIDYGASLVKFIATESAIPILSEDWVSIEMFVREAEQRQEFRYIVVLDHRGIVRGSSTPEMIGTTYEEGGEAALTSEGGGVKVFSRRLSDKSKIFDFYTPVLFQDKEVGTVHLGLSQDSLERAARLTMFMMILLMVITITAVAVVAYVLGNYMSRPIDILRQSLIEIREGNLNHRISLKRNDEFGQLFEAFDSMAESLQERHEQDASSD
jgi:serine/threonine protein kinase/HAMP domain-containing protein